MRYAIAPVPLLYVMPVLPLKSVNAIPVASVNVNGTYLLVPESYFNTCPFVGDVVLMSDKESMVKLLPISSELVLIVIVSVPAFVVISIPVPSVKVIVSLVPSALTVVCPVTAKFLNASSTLPPDPPPPPAAVIKSTFCILPYVSTVI